MAQDEARFKELTKIISDNPTAEEFLEYARSLSAQGKATEAREVLIRGLNRHQENAPARLLLAKLYYDEGLGEFCVRELVELKKYCNAPALGKLLDAFGEYAHPFLAASNPTSVPNASEEFEQSEEEEERRAAVEEDEEGDILAEIDLDADFDEAFDEIDE